MKNLKFKKFLIILAGTIAVGCIFTFVYREFLSNKPNIILITLDALRPDHLSCYGYKRKTTPNIDEVAKGGIIFTQAISQASVTIVSLASLLTSVYPSRHGIITQHLDCHNDFSYPTIMQILKRDNYKTATFLSPMSSITIPRWRQKGVDYSFKYKYEKENFLLSDSALLTQATIKWLKSNPKLPFFIWIHYNDPHAPYTPPPPYNKLYVYDEFYNPDKKAPLVDNLEGWGGIAPKANLNNIQEIDYYISQYDGEIKYTDYWIGELMHYLKTEGLYDNSLVIICADHGEAFGEHNLYFEHAHTLYDELLRVPLIIKLPKGAFGGKIITRQVRLVDIMPIILEYLNLEIPQEIDGESLLPLISEKGEYEGRFSFSKTHTMNAMRNEEWKLIYCEGDNHYELYNFKDDPKELVNLYEKENEIAKILKTELEKYLKVSLYRKKKLKKIDEGTRERLRSLGYLQ